MLVWGPEGLVPAVLLVEQVRQRLQLEAGRLKWEGIVFQLEEVRSVPRVPDPEKVCCLGRNYRAHAEGHTSPRAKCRPSHRGGMRHEGGGIRALRAA